LVVPAVKHNITVFLRRSHWKEEFGV